MRTRFVLANLSLIAVGFFAACNDGPRPPTQPSPSLVPPTVAPASVVELKIEGPSSVPPGETSQFSATARFADGSSRDVTGQARWSSSSEAVLSISQAGLSTGRNAGEATVSASFGSRIPHKEVVVVPAGRYRLRGRVTQGSATIIGARVEVIGGPAAGLATTTDFSGQYWLYGVPTDAEVRVTKDGYEPSVRSVHVEEQSGALNVELFLLARRPDLSGTYTLTIGGGTCSGPSTFPAALHTRTYTAVVRQNGPSLMVELPGADFEIDRFSGHFQAVDAWFTLAEFVPAEPWWSDAVYPNVVERLSDGRFLAIPGLAVATLSPEGLSGTLDGALRIYAGTRFVPPFEPRLVETCESRSHRFALSR